MSYRFQLISEVVDADLDSLLADSVDAYNSGTAMYSSLPNVNSAEDFKLFLQGKLSGAFSGIDIFPVKFECRDDDRLLGIYYASRNPAHSGYLTIHVSVYGRNSAGSKSWLYSDEYGSAFRDFISGLGYAGIASYYAANSAMNPHNENQRLSNQNGYTLWEDVEGATDDLRLLKLTI